MQKGRWKGTGPTSPKVQARSRTRYSLAVVHCGIGPIPINCGRANFHSESRPKEERRRTKTLLKFFDEKSCLKLCYASLIRASLGWRRVAITEFKRVQLDLLRKQLHQEYLARRGKAVQLPPAKPKETVTAA